jgi:hypothetical protein
MIGKNSKILNPLTWKPLELEEAPPYTDDMKIVKEGNTHHDLNNSSEITR